MSIRVLLVDDHRMFREALRIPLAAETDITIVGEAGNGEQAIECVSRLRPDVLVLDIALPDMNGIEVARQAIEKYPAIRIVALSGYADKLFVEEMLKAGARGYVVKSAGADELLRAIRAVIDGHLFLSPEITGAALGRPAGTAQSAPPLSRLGKREQAVLSLLARGMRSSEISETLRIATATVNAHRRNIKKKLGLSSTAELTRYAIREGLQSI